MARMKFLLIDHSLKGPGGHHYEYASLVLRQARSCGLDVALAAHRRFHGRRTHDFPAPVFSVYRHKLIHLTRLDAIIDRAARQQAAAGRAAPVARWYRVVLTLQATRYRRQKERLAGRFVRATARVLTAFEMQPGDLVFVPTLSPSDLECLNILLRTHPEFRELVWHFQFHFQLFSGREPDYGPQLATADRIRQVFEETRQLLPPFGWHCYTTTEHLARQYDKLSVVPFQTLPWPVDPAFRLDRQATSKRPLRVACLGGTRAEKGLETIARILEPLWNNYFASHRLRLVVQAKSRRKVPRTLRSRIGRPAHSARHDSPSVALIGWPLPATEYRRQVVMSDIGLLLYEEHSYYARCSGVLVELLTAGIPVIVKAGCWMADQLASAIKAHLDGLRGDCRLIQSTQRRLADDSQPGGGFTSLEIPPATTHAMVSIRGAARDIHGMYVAISSLQTAPSSSSAYALTRDILGLAPDGVGRVLIPIEPASGAIRISWADPYGDRPVPATSITFEFLSAADLPEQRCPLGAVGLVAADVEQVPRLLAEMAANYSHYAATARTFREAWGAWHSPAEVLRQLLSRSGPGRPPHPALVTITTPDNDRPLH